MTYNDEELRWDEEPIELEAIDRLYRLGRDADGENIGAVVIARFHHEAERWIGEIRCGLTGGDLATVKQIAHTLRGSASILGAGRLVATCGELETCAEGRDIEGCNSSFPMFEAALSEALSALSRAEQIREVSSERQ